MQIVMWRTTKRDNSTATPDSEPTWFTNRVTYDVCLKEPTDVLNPSFILKMTGHDGQNYLQAFGRYYWISSIRILAKDLFELNCKIDPLGSYRGHIRNTQAYVLYDSTPNTEIPDNRLGVRTTPTTAQSTTEMPWGFASGQGTKFIALVGDGDLVTQHKAQSATGVYTVTDSDIQKIGMDFTIQDITDCLSTSWSQSFPAGMAWNTSYGILDSIDDIKTATQTAIQSADIAGVIGLFLIMAVMFPIFGFLLPIIDVIRGLILDRDILSNIKSCYWLPFDCRDEGTSYSDIAVGSFVDNLPGAKLITSPFKTTVVNVGIPWQYSDWRNVQNTEIQIFIPLIGNVNIPASAVKGHSTISVKMNLNMFSGTFSVRLQCGDTTLGSFGANCAMPILIGDSNPDTPAITNTVVGVAGAIAGVATGNVALTAGAVASGIQSGLNCLQPISTSVGGIGGGAGNQLGIVIVCTTICHNTSDAPSDLLPIIGTPTNVLKQLNGTGFCQTMQAHMSMNAVTGESYPTEAEVQQVNSALNSGVFLE